MEPNSLSADQAGLLTPPLPSPVTPSPKIEVAGPGAIDQKGIDPQPLLDGASEYEYIELFNPLSVDFKGLVGVTRPANAPMRINSPDNPLGSTSSESELRNNYGLNLRNPDFQGKANLQNVITIPSGKTLRLLGSEAQVILRQLVNEVMARTGKKMLRADAHARREVETQIVISRGSVAQLMGSQPQTVQQQLHDAIKEPEREEFPEFNQSSGTSAGATPAYPGASPGSGDPAQFSSAPADHSPTRPPGRPKKV